MKKCCVCLKNKLGQTRKITNSQRQFFVKQGKVVEQDGTICNKCRQIFYAHERQFTEPAASNTTPEKRSHAKADPVITLPIVTVGKTSRKCVVCKTMNGPFVALPENGRLQVFVQQGLLVPAGVRCCPCHLDGKNLKNGIEIDKSRLRKTKSEVSASDIMWLLDRLREMVKTSKKKRLDFDDPTALSDDDVISLTGINKDQLQFLCKTVIKLKKSSNRTPRTAIAMLLVKLKTGLSHRYLATLFGIGRKRAVSKIIQQAKVAISEDFVPLYIGFHHISREQIIENHTTHFATQLFSNFLSNSVITIMDGTYIYIQKSGKYTFQRMCFSMHKHRPLVKPMIVTSSDGYILSIIGPYFADGKNNDASIVQHMMKTNDENMMKWFRKDDILILDRGFRDALDFLHEIGFQTESPAFLNKSEKQFSTHDGNLSRLVTTIRWAVESVNARIKSWRYFEKVVPNTDLLNLKQYLRIVGALCNKFKPPLITSVEAHCSVAQHMLEMSKQPNKLQEKISQDKSLSKRSRQWVPLHECRHYDNFPRLSEEYLRSLTFGVYQLKQAPHYADQYLLNGDIDIYLHSVNATIVQAKLQSRHTSSKQYMLWIEIDETNNTVPIRGWYCECKVGARTVGCCAHIATILWYMGHARHLNYEAKSDKFSAAFQDAAVEVQTETDMESDDYE